MLSSELVHRKRGAEDATARVRKSEDLQGALEHAVLPAATMQRDERPVEPTLAHPLQHVEAGIDTVGIHPTAAQRL